MEKQQIQQMMATTLPPEHDWYWIIFDADNALKGARNAEDNATRRAKLQDAVRSIKIAMDLLPGAK